jgi:hypothetical protein
VLTDEATVAVRVMLFDTSAGFADEFNAIDADALSTVRETLPVADV